MAICQDACWWQGRGLAHREVRRRRPTSSATKMPDPGHPAIIVHMENALATVLQPGFLGTVRVQFYLERAGRCFVDDSEGGAVVLPDGQQDGVDLLIRKATAAGVGG